VQGKSVKGLLVASNGFNEAIVYISIALTGKKEATVYFVASF
jgi:hypothetical protein